MKQQSVKDILPHLFRQEYAKMTAVLCRLFGIHHIEIAEDLASDTFLKASEYWALHGIPENPSAWLYTVAKNKAKDYYKHTSIAKEKLQEIFRTTRSEVEQETEASGQYIKDSQLAMIFAVCDPAIPVESQICLALQILCGFSIAEIADALLSKPETIKKKLARARESLRNTNFQIILLSETEIKSRLSTVLKTLYLLFSEGYFSKSSQYYIRKELCLEAIRLTLILTESTLTNIPQTDALLALMCFQSSRLEARTDPYGKMILFDKQDTSLWDQSLIEKGNYYLVKACTGNEVSKYHLEAAIAYWHTTVGNEKKWPQILELYNQLISIENSPVTALNRLYAFSRVYGKEKALEELLKGEKPENSYYYELLGFLYADTEISKAIHYYSEAIKLVKSGAEKQHIQEEIERLKDILG
ncbi:RNA polymerase sigma factor [Elizabethkingia ursingii]|uniref:RNA polymerase sigma factor n=1 Tax=Elizabethkingia ursingii TaxID=1756150 RepID=UPI0032C3ED04